MKLFASAESWLTPAKALSVSTKPYWGYIRGGAVG